MWEVSKSGTEKAPWGERRKISGHLCIYLLYFASIFSCGAQGVDAGTLLL